MDTFHVSLQARVRMIFQRVHKPRHDARIEDDQMDILEQCSLAWLAKPFTHQREPDQGPSRRILYDLVNGTAVLQRAHYVQMF